MTQEEIKFLITDLCGRIQYNVVCHISQQSQYKKDRNIDVDDVLVAINKDGVCEFEKTTGYFFGLFDLEEVKPYLRPMSSMTKEERRELNKQGDTNIAGESWHYCALNLNNAFYNPEGYKYVRIKYVIPLLDWLNKHHFDYRGLIEKGLALEAPEGMYDEKE